MSQIAIRKAFEKSLIGLVGKSKISFENVPFSPPASEYYICKITAGEVRNPTLGDSYHREVGFFVVVVCINKDIGHQQASSFSEAIKSAYRRGTTLVEGDTTVIVDRTPSIGNAYIDGKRYCIPVRISYFTNEF